MSLEACARLVERADPDRFAAAMALPLDARRVLLPIYAANVEIARAPYAASEPLIQQMRLQWWRDALGEISAGGPVRRHEVTTPLGEVLPVEGADLMQRVVDARHWDVAREPFASEAALWGHLEATAGALTAASALALGWSGDRAALVRAASGAGLAGWLRAVPDYRGLGVEPLPDGSMDTIRGLAEKGLGRMESAPRGARAALLWGWLARPILRQAVAEPGRVGRGALGVSEFSRRGRLLVAALRV